MFHPIPLSPLRSHKPHPALHGTVVQDFQIAIVVQRGKRVIEFFFFFLSDGARGVRGAWAKEGESAQRSGRTVGGKKSTLLLLDGGSPCDTY